MNKQYFKSCQRLDDDGNCCNEPVYRKLQIFADSTLHGHNWFDIYLCKKHYKGINRE